MRLKILLMTILLAVLGVGSFAYAADEAKDDVTITGFVDLGVQSVQDKGKSAKFNEYRDVRTGVFTNMEFGGDNGYYYVDITGENVGRDDQSFEVKGGRFGLFDYKLFYNETIHNLTFDAKTFYANPGSSNLIYGYANGATGLAAYTPTVPLNSGQWNTFDYSVKRKDVGATVDFTFGTPFYVTVDASQNEKKGIVPFGTPSNLIRDYKNSTSASLFLELPIPIDYRTNNLNLKAGYNTKKYSFSITGSLSKFENENPYVNFQNPGVTTQSRSEFLSEPSDNENYKLSMQGAVRQLPLNSAVAVQLGYSKLKSDFTIPSILSNSSNTATGNVNPTYNTETLGLNKSSFKGDITYQTASVALTSEPIKALDTKIHFNYLNKENKSDIIEFTNPTTKLTTDTEVFNYKKYNVGADAGYKITKTTKASVGYEFEQVKRDRVDFDSTKDNRVYGEIKDSSLEWLTAKAKYQRLWRNSSFLQDNDSNVYWRYFRKYDAANKIQDSVKLGLEFDPINHLNFGLEYIYKNNDYKDTLLGVTKDQRHEFYVDASYEIPDIFKVTAFFDYETVDSTDAFRSNAADPRTPSTSSGYNYSQDLKDRNFLYGLALQAPIIKDKLQFVASWTYEEANGAADFNVPAVATAAVVNTFINLSERDDYKKQSLSLKLIYKATKNLDLTLGYAYEKYQYSDISMNDYAYWINSTTSPFPVSGFLSGSNYNQPYEVNLFYMQVGYKF
jgi:MtrB/PioB family decaheme-associated outer membrane protein